VLWGSVYSAKCLTTKLADIGLIVKNSRTLGLHSGGLCAKPSGLEALFWAQSNCGPAQISVVRFSSFPNEVRVLGCLAQPQRKLRSTHQKHLERHPSKLCLTTRNSIARHPDPAFLTQTVSSLFPPPSAVLQFKSD